MRRFIFIIAILIISVIIGLEIAKDPGYAIFAYRDWTVEMPLWFAVFSFTLLILVMYLLLRFVDGINASWVQWKNWLWLRRKHKSYSKTNRGLIELIEANWKGAENDLIQGVDQSDAPLINFLAAAKAAHEQGAFERRDTYLRKAYDLSPQAKIAVGLTQAQLQLNQGKFEQALATLNQLRNEAPKQTLVLKLLERVFIHLGDWKNLLKLIPALRKAKIITSDQMAMLECKTYQELLRSTSKAESSATVKQVWQAIPGKIQKNSDVIYAYAKQLAKHADTCNEAEELIVRAVNKAWHADMVKLYGTIQGANPTKQLKIAEDWLKQYGTHGALLLTLARLSVRAQIWGKARHYFEDCLKTDPSSVAYIEYGNLLQHMDDSQAAMRHYREGLQKVVVST